jgi:hypothetical protein
MQNHLNQAKQGTTGLNAGELIAQIKALAGTEDNSVFSVLVADDELPENLLESIKGQAAQNEVSPALSAVLNSLG